jgi:hypothetical protein
VLEEDGRQASSVLLLRAVMLKPAAAHLQTPATGTELGMPLQSTCGSSKARKARQRPTVVVKVTMRVGCRHDSGKPGLECRQHAPAVDREWGSGLVVHLRHRSSDPASRGRLAGML